MTKKYIVRTTALSAALGLALFGTASFAQSTTGSLFGQAPAANGETVLIESSSGITREVPVDAKGRYSAGQLPLGTYTVSLRQGGATVDTRKNISLVVGANTEVSFVSSDATTLSAVSVSAAVTPLIDVTSVDSRTVITADQLTKMPLARNAEAIALLAPGVVTNSGNFTGPTGQQLTSFGGSAASENAYYLNGFNTTDPLRGFGGITLPYGAIDQQEIYTGGYSAQYGRSDGGVINQVGKRGTNDWHFGAQVLWQPAWAAADAKNTYYTQGLPASPVAGGLYDPNSKDKTWVTTVDAYVGGPIIKDKLFFFAAVEAQRSSATTVNSVENTSPYTQYTYEQPKWYGKLDWNITDSNILEVTGASNKRSANGSIYGYDYVNRARGAYIGATDSTKTGGDLYTAKFTSYITDDLTLTALYGKMKTRNYDAPGSYNPDFTYVNGTSSQNPALNGGSAITSPQTVQTLFSPDRANHTNNLRVDLTYKIGDHTISAGIDNQNARALAQGSQTSGPGYYWTYGQTDTPDVPLSSGLGVGATSAYANGADGYYVVKHVANSLASVRSAQRAQYIEDSWQVNDRWLVKIGLRNDQFTDYNANGQAYITQTKPQLAPRLGASWDVNGDSSFKIYANAGRYYLGLPLNPALNAAGAYVATSQYYTYSGVAADGTPTGLTQMSAPVSANNAFGILPDPKTVTARNLKSENQDEFLLGFTKTAGDNWIYGAKVTRRILRDAIDDYCDLDTVLGKAQSLGYDVTSDSNPVSCWLFNPGAANTFNLVDTAGNYHNVSLSNKELGFDALKRKYYGLETFLEHPFDGTWYAKMDYVFSRSYGNTEGQLRSDLQQTAASTSEDWDNGAIMDNTNGPQSNDHKHQFKLFGYYQLTPEWIVSANLSLVSGAPKTCLGYFGPDQTDPVGYAPSYHWCDGQPSPPGSHGRLPWVRQLDLGATWRPTFGAGKLAFTANIYNVNNGQTETNIYPYSVTAPYTTDPKYGLALVRQQPRYVQFGVSYDY